MPNSYYTPRYQQRGGGGGNGLIQLLQLFAKGQGVQEAGTIPGQEYTVDGQTFQTADLPLMRPKQSNWLGRVFGNAEQGEQQAQAMNLSARMMQAGQQNDYQKMLADLAAQRTTAIGNDIATKTGRVLNFDPSKFAGIETQWNPILEDKTRAEVGQATSLAKYGKASTDDAATALAARAHLTGPLASEQAVLDYKTLMQKLEQFQGNRELSNKNLENALARASQEGLDLSYGADMINPVQREIQRAQLLDTLGNLKSQAAVAPSIRDLNNQAALVEAKKKSMGLMFQPVETRGIGFNPNGTTSTVLPEFHRPETRMDPQQLLNILNQGKDGSSLSVPAPQTAAPKAPRSLLPTETYELDPATKRYRIVIHDSEGNILGFGS